jgi:hypothetical protein
MPHRAGVSRKGGANDGRKDEGRREEAAIIMVGFRCGSEVHRKDFEGYLRDVFSGPGKHFTSKAFKSEILNSINRRR